MRAVHNGNTFEALYAGQDFRAEAAQLLNVEAMKK
jgi:hypothetical protein